ncbi:hypothetical protein R6G99_06460, partial [Actinotignum timonense]|nr:hypothetical protein [Actinotignum timonense]
MIAGIGTDTVAIDAFAQQLDLPGSRFRNVFTAREMRYAIRRAQRHTRTGWPATWKNWPAPTTPGTARPESP